MDSSSLPSTSTALVLVITNRNRNKRKSPSQLALLRKRIRQNLITCPIAISILRDLGLQNRSTLNSANFLAWTVDPIDPIFQTIHSYVSNGQPGKELASVHPHQFGIKVLGMLRITLGGIPPQFDDNPANRGKPRMMLWKGMRAIDARNVLKNGVKLGKVKFVQYWGAGYCFSDSLCDAILMNYDYRYWRNGEKLTDSYRPGNIAYLFFYEVLLDDDMYVTYTEEPEGPVVTVQEPRGRVTVKSIKCEGKWTVDPLGNEEIDGCVWPLGKRMRNGAVMFADFWGNHYTVFDESRVIPRYLVQVEITEKEVEEKIG